MPVVVPAGGMMVKNGSIYQYFPSKVDIYDALFAHGHRQLHVHMAELDRTGDVEAVFRRGSAMFTEFCTADAVRYQLLFQRTIPGFVPSEESMALAWQSYQDMTGVLAMLGVHDQADVDLWTAMQMGLTELQIANDPGGQRWSAQVGRSIDMFLGFVRERPPRRKN